MRALPSLGGIPVATGSRDVFRRVYGHLFEHSPWVVERAWEARPFADAAALARAFDAVIAAAATDAQLALIRAHPELGQRIKIRDGSLTASSASEQAGAGLDQLTETQFKTFQFLNAAYRERFGFPFVICVRLHDLVGIEAAMRRRLGQEAETERAEALRQIGLIGALRLASVALPEGLPAHEQRLAHALETLAFPRDWGERTLDGAGRPVLDVVIVGAGQCGLAAAFGLLREGVRNILVLDENSEGSEGPWVTYARMLTLRTPKELTPIDFGIPALTFRAWWEAQYGAASWHELGRIPREDWMRYLLWYRRVLDLPVRNGEHVELIEPLGDNLFAIHLAGGARITARKVVLATGIQGGGAWWTPEFVRDSLPAHLYAHTSEPIAPDQLRSRRVAILGAGASAFDNAQHALREGAASVDVFVRRSSFPRVNPIRYLERSGLLRNFPLLDDASKYRVIDHFLRHAQPPTNDTFSRAAAYPNFTLHLGEGWSSLAPVGESVRIETPKGNYEFDFLILSTGLRNDPALRPELARVRGEIALWRDRYQPDVGERNPALDEHPYLGGGFELTARTEAGRAQLHGLFVFNYSALASLGLSASALSGLKPALPRLVGAITGQLFLDQQDTLLASFINYDEQEFEGQWPAA